MATIEYENLHSIVSSILGDQNIGYDTLGIQQDVFEDMENPCFDMALLKKLEGSNAAGRGDISTHQSSIILTGDQWAIFPCISRKSFNNNQIGKHIVLRVPVYIMSNNLAYLRGEEIGDNHKITTWVTTNETTQNRIELGCKSLDGDDYVGLYESLSAGDWLLILKHKGQVEYTFFAIRQEDTSRLINDFETQSIFTYFTGGRVTRRDAATFVNPENIIEQPTGINKLIYGAPGTGKSFKVNKEYYDPTYSIRVNFHPEYSYSDFVGYIKPVVENQHDLSYQFVAGPFTEILTRAINDPSHMYNLIIEEMNRGNAVAIFGELFQLLDRNSSNGQSEYTVYNREIYDYVVGHSEEGNCQFEEGKIFIPGNLSIVATMNSADQNVFVMDTAFKRRWKYEYLPIQFQDNHGYKCMNVPKINVTWQAFVNGTNEFMLSEQCEELMIAEDKQIGPYFAKAEEIGNADDFCAKVLGYLWEDVFKLDRAKVFKNNIRSYGQLLRAFSQNSVSEIFNDDYIEFIRHAEPRPAELEPRPAEAEAELELGPAEAAAEAEPDTVETIVQLQLEGDTDA